MGGKSGSITAGVLLFERRTGPWSNWRTLGSKAQLWEETQLPSASRGLCTGVCTLRNENSIYFTATSVIG